MKNFKYFFVLLVVNNFIHAMNEAKHNSLASFFSADILCSHKDIEQHIVFHHCADKQWWYVDKEVQFCHEKDSALWGTPEGNNLERVQFNIAGTEVIAFPEYDGNSCYACVWDRRSGKELERVDYATFFVKNEVLGDQIWKERAYEAAYNRKGWRCKQQLLALANEKEQAWLEKFKEGYAPIFDKSGMVLMIRSDSRVCVWDRMQDKETLWFVHKGEVNSTYFNQIGTEIITTSDDGTMHLWHAKTGKELLRVMYGRPVKSAKFNELGTEIIVGTDDGKIQVLAHYYPKTLSQILLKKLLHLWLQLKRPSKKINSPNSLLWTIASLLRCNLQELQNAWNLFPDNMQNALWLSMHKKIQKYGK